MSDDRNLYAETAARVFAEKATPATIEAAEHGAFPRALWDQLEELGFLSMLVDEAQGGVGADLEDAAAVAHTAGFHAAPGPIAETMVARWLAASAGLDLPEGPLTLLIGEGKHRAAWLREARGVRVAGDRIVILDAAMSAENGVTIAGEPLDRLAGSDPPGIAGTLDDAEGMARRAMAILRAGQMAGAMQWCVERSVDYVQDRQQFGRPLAKLQVVQQYLAQAAGDFVAADTLAGLAARAGAGAPAELLVAAARVRAAEAADVVAALCHQVHGAIGYSREYALNFRTRRLMAWRDDGATTVYWRRAIGRAICAAGRSPWSSICDAAATA